MKKVNLVESEKNIVNGVDTQKLKQEADELFRDFEEKNQDKFPKGKERSGNRNTD